LFFVPDKKPENGRSIQTHLINQQPGGFQVTITIEVDNGNVARRLQALAGRLADARLMFREIAGILEHETEENFEAQGRPHWVPLAKSTVRARTKRNKGSSVLKILQDRGILAGSISSEYGQDYAQIGSNVAYAAIHQFGGTIDHAERSVRTRLRTDKKGNLLRQGGQGRSKNLAVFAKDSHKQARETWHHANAWKVTIPARPFLPFYGSADNATLQPEAARSILEAISGMLNEHP
jgi:phage virion morphogenesis protein